MARTLAPGLRELLLAISLGLASAAAGLTPIADGDVFWHLAAGRQIASSGAVPQVDGFSSGAAGRPWIDVHWLFQLGVYAVERAGGLYALVATKCMLIALGALLLLRAVERSARPLLVLWLSTALLCARHLLLVRPVIASLVFLGLFFLQLERHRRSGAMRALWVLPLYQVVWSNCQGLSALGPAFVLAYALGAAGSARLGRRRWLAFAREHGEPRALLISAGLCIAASLATPYGLRALQLPLALLDRLLPHAQTRWAEVAENVPPFALERVQPGELWHLQWYLGGLAIALLLGRRRVVLSHMLLLLGVLGLALLANRNVLLLYWIATPIAACQLAARVRGLRAQLARGRGHSLLPWLGPVALVAYFVVAARAAAAEPSLGAPTPFHFPIRSAELLQRTPGQGAIFAADQHGGYLIWTLYPRFRPYMDTRLVLRTAQEFAEYLGLLENPERFAAFQRRHHFSYAILPVAYPDRYLPLIAQLYRDPEWTLIFTNGSETLFARRELSALPAVDLHGSATTDRMLAAIAQQFGRDPRVHEAARLAAASLQLALDEPAQAERTLAAMASMPARALLARAKFARGDLDGAQRVSERLLLEHDDDIRSLDSLAAVAMRRGQLELAGRYLQRALALDPYDAEAISLRETLEHSHE